MTAPASEAHEYWSADQTAYLRSLSPEDRTAWAVHYQRPPVTNDSGTTSLSLNFPVLIITAYSSEPEKIARRVVEILNKHWDEEPTQ